MMEVDPVTSTSSIIPDIPQSTLNNTTMNSSSSSTTAAATTASTFDLDTYISRYDPKSETRLQRLLFIAQNCTFDADVVKQAYWMAEQHLKQRGNVKKYREIFGPTVAAAASNHSNHGMEGAGVVVPEMLAEDNNNNSNNNTPSHGITYDAKWTTTTLSQSQTQLETLEARLSTAQSHLAKESIRSAYLSLADYSKARGNLKESLKYTLRSRDYCTDVRRSASMCLSVIELGIDLGNYPQVHSYVSKAEHTTDLVNGDSVVAAKLKVASGIALMQDGRYADAANKFTSVSADLDGGMMYPSVASAEDVALYGSLLGLASLDRHSLQISVLDSTLFKQKLELLPWMRDALRHFRLAEYGSCLQILEQHRNTDMMLDLHLSRHAGKLLDMVRDRCLVQYFLPYSSVSLDKMAKSFGRSVEEMEDAVAALIGKKKIRGRINAQDRTLLARVDNYRGDTLKKVKRLGDEFVRETESMILRMSCIEQELIVQSDHPQNYRGSSSSSSRHRHRAREGGGMQMYDDSSEEEGDFAFQDESIMMDLDCAGAGGVSPESEEKM